ncbi:HAD-IA family hydrolase [Pseudonocardia sp. T1-2H]|uniref:HAD-IA family hydrolase n=1 Tax=Pseudonocardia sp. T1-2H TaxID=3128899 RepID=UPI003100B549
MAVVRPVTDLRAVRAVLFDMDGTLVNSDAAVERAWRTWAGEYGVDPERVIRVGHGRPSWDTIREVCPDLDDAENARAGVRQLELQYTDLADVVATAGTHRLLATLTLPWAIVTSADRRLTAARLGAAGITPPKVVITSEDVVRGKPDPDGYLQAAAALGVPPEACLVVEDADAGLAAARAAGARTAALRGLAGDVPIKTLDDLVPLLTRRVGPGRRSRAPGR